MVTAEIDLLPVKWNEQSVVILPFRWQVRRILGVVKALHGRIEKPIVVLREIYPTDHP